MDRIALQLYVFRAIIHGLTPYTISRQKHTAEESPERYGTPIAAYSKILKASIIFIAGITMPGLDGSTMKVIRILRTTDEGNAPREETLGI